MHTIIQIHEIWKYAQLQNLFCRVTDSCPDDVKEEAEKENLADIEESKPEDTSTLPVQKEKAGIFSRKMKSKCAAKKPSLWEQNIENMKNKNLKNK